MRIVLSGALPEPRLARELTPYLKKSAPTLVQIFEQYGATRILADSSQAMCTGLEQWLLNEYKFAPRPKQHVGAGVSLLTLLELLECSEKSAISNIDAARPLWFLELVNISPSRDGAILTLSNELEISKIESQQLFESATESFKAAKFDVSFIKSNVWLAHLPNNMAPKCASPSLVSTDNLNNWWSKSQRERPWRKLSNEIQMLWFDHPVNKKRFDQQKLPINGLWLYGGAALNQINNSVIDKNIIINRSLENSYNAQDWGVWIETLKQLDNDIKSQKEIKELVLIGEACIVSLSPVNNIWSKLGIKRKQPWEKWWQPPS